MRGIGFSSLVLITSFSLAAGAHAQAPPPQSQPAAASAIDGRWEGTVDTPDGPAQAVAELKLEAGVIKGTMTAGQYALAITGGTLTGDAVALTFDIGGMLGSMAATLKDGVLQGSWNVEGEGGGFALKKAGPGAAASVPAATPSPAGGVAPAAAAAPAAPANAMSAADLTGDWDAVADVGGQSMPFTLTLKVDGEKVTGSTTSQQGTTTIEGTYAGGQLTFGITTPDGMSIVMSGKPEAGKIAGTFDVGGGMGQGGWSAAKRK